MNTTTTSQTKWQTVRKNGRKTNVERLRLKNLAFELLQSGLTQKETAKKIGTCKETIRIWANQHPEALTPQTHPETSTLKSNVSDLLQNRFIKMLENEETTLPDLLAMNNLIKEHKKA